MSILIEGMAMPPTGNYFMMVENKPGIEPNVTVWSRKLTGDLEHFAFFHPIEIPPHGDLIDRDAFAAENDYYLHRDFINAKYEDTLADLLKAAPVVIPAEEATE